MDCTYFDVRVFNPRAQSNETQDITRTYIKHEEAKKKNYLHRVLEVEKASFTPLVMSTTGGLGQEFSRTLKQLATKKSRKTGYTYQECIRYLRVRLSFSMVRSITCSIRGYRGRNKNDDSSSDLYHRYQSLTVACILCVIFSSSRYLSILLILLGLMHVASFMVYLFLSSF